MRIDLLLDHGSIHTGLSAEAAGALAVHGGRIVAVGKGCDGLDAARRVDLGGRVVVPGFHDAHNHMAWFGMSLDELDLSSPAVERLEQVYARVEERAKAQGPGTWIVGGGYDQQKLAGGHPTRGGLDRVAPRHHVLLRHASGHMCVVNSLVLDQLDLRAVPDGGDVVLDAAGHPTGLLREQALLALRPLVYPVPEDVLVRAIDKAGRRYLSEGITSVQEAGVGGGWIGRSPVEVGAYQRARGAGLLHVRTKLMVALEALHGLDHHESDTTTFGLDLGIRSGLGDDRLALGPVKIFADGSLIGRTAAMSSAYSDDPANFGSLQMPEEELRASVLAAHRSGWQIAAHAIGDRAVHAVLDAYEAALVEAPRPDHRHRIEHCGVSRPEHLETMARLGVVAVPQGRFVEEIGDGMRAALGEERVGWCYRARSFLDAGIALAASSDRPVVDGAPLLGISAMVRRRTSTGAPFSPGERLSPAEALAAYTHGSAYAGFAEHRVGRLVPGMLADLAVLSGDLPGDDDVPLPKVEGTLIEGEAVYDPTGLLAG